MDKKLSTEMPSTSIPEKLVRVLVTAFIILSIASFVSRNGFASWEDDLVDYPSNPVFDPPSGNRIYYPTIIYDSDGFGNGAAGPFYRLWFSNGSGIGTGESDNGIDWTETADSSGLTNAHHARVLYDSNGFGNGAAGPFYRIWYWDTANLYNIAAIRTAESDDGVVWSNDQSLTQDGVKPIIPGGAGEWNRGSYGPIDLFYQPGAANTGTNPFDYEYVMYYDGTTGAFEQIGLGYSADGIHWIRYGDDPVLPCGVDWTVPGNWGSPTPWDSSYATFGSVIRDSDGNFHLWYSGGTTASNEGIGYASSDDGLTWVKWDSNPFIDNVAGSWHSQRSYTPTVTYDVDRYSGHGDNSEFKLWFAGRNDGGDYQLGYYGVAVGTAAVSQGTVPDEPTCLEESGFYILPLLQLIVDVDGVEDVTIDELVNHFTGTSVDESAIEATRLYRDLDMDGEIDDGDQLLAEANIDGSANADFTAIDESMNASSSVYFLIAAVVATTSDADLTLEASFENASDLIGSGAISNQLLVEATGVIAGKSYALGVCNEEPPTPTPPGPSPDPEPDNPTYGIQGGACGCRISDGGFADIAASPFLHIMIWGFILFGIRRLIKHGGKHTG